MKGLGRWAWVKAMRWVNAALVWWLVLGQPGTPALGQDASPPPEIPEGGPDAAEFGGSAGGDLSFGNLGSDFFVTVYLAASFAVGKLAVGVQVPLRLRLVDRAPDDDGVVRAEDWDEVSDYFRIIRFVQWSQPGDVFYVRAGELSGATLGHGTMMNNYLNVVDIDHFQLGIDTEVNTAYGGGEAVLDNVADPEIVGVRLYARPWSFVDVDSFLTRWSVGTSIVADAGAPEVIRVDDAGEPRVDRHNNLQYSTNAVVLWGLDNDFTVVDTELVRVTPYVDNNFLFGDATGYGFHAGVLTSLSLPADSGADLRLEYQYLGAHYAPQYVDTLYEVQRAAYPSPAAYEVGVVPLTKAMAVGARDRGAHGYLGQLGVRILGLVGISGQYRGSQRPFDHELLLQAVLPKISRVQLGAIYSKSGFDQFVDALDPDGAMFTAYARLNVWAFVDLVARFSRSWQVDSDPGSPSYGRYETVDEWGAGVGVSFDF